MVKPPPPPAPYAAAGGPAPWAYGQAPGQPPPPFGPAGGPAPWAYGMPATVAAPPAAPMSPTSPFGPAGGPANWAYNRTRNVPPPPPPGGARGGAGGAPGGIPGVAFPNDAIYLASLAQQKMGRKTAAGDYLEAVKRLALGFGDVNLARSLVGGAAKAGQPYTGVRPDLGSYYNQFQGATDPNTSFSWLAQHNREVQRGTADTMNQQNQQNLYFSGHGAQALSDFDYGEQGKLKTQLASVQDAARQAQQGFYGTLQSSQQAGIQAANAAYGRAVQAARGGVYDVPGLHVGATAQPNVPAPPAPPVVRSPPKRKQIRYSSPNYVTSGR